MSQAGFSNRGMAGKMEVHHSVIDRLMQRLEATGMVDEHPRYRRRRKTTPIEDRLIARCARKNRFPTPARIRDALNFGDHVSINEQRLCTR
jgi:transposase